MIENYKDEEFFNSIKDLEENLISEDDIKKYNLVKHLIMGHFRKDSEIKVERIKTENNNIIDLLTVKNSIDTLIIDFNEGNIITLKSDPKNPCADRTSFNVDGIIRGKLLEKTDDKRLLLTAYEIVEKYDDFLAKSLSNIDTYIFFKEYEKTKHLEEIYFIGYNVAMYVNCRTGIITQYTDNITEDILELTATIEDKSLCRPDCLEEILEKMHSHNKPVINNNQSLGR